MVRLTPRCCGDNGATCCRARRKLAVNFCRGRVPGWLWVLMPRRMHLMHHGYVRLTPLRIAVIAGSYVQFVVWCREKGLNPRTGPAFYATANTLAGVRNAEIVRIGTWAKRDDLAEVDDALRYVNRRSA